MADEQGQLQDQQPEQSATVGTGTVPLSSSATPVEFSWQEAAVSTVTDLHNAAAAAAADAASQQLLAAHNLLPPPPADASADAAAQASALAAAPLSGEDAAMHLQAFEQLQPADAYLKAQAAHLPGTSVGAELAEQEGVTVTRRQPDVPAAKLCPACHHWKSSADFLRISKNADGLAHKCKACAMKAVDGPTLAEKACSKCKEVKPKSQFCINKYMQDGMQSQCKSCAKAGRKKVDGPQVNAKVCKLCSVNRPAHEFHQDKRNPDGLHMHCKICRKRKSAPTASEIAVTEKTCSRCGEQKGASSFYVDKQAQCGLEAQCKECRRASRRLVTEVTVVQKDCARCHATRSAEEFYRDKHASDGLQSYCKLCMKSRAVPKDSDDGSNPTVPRKRRQLAVPNGQLQEDIEAMQRAHAGAELALPIQMTGLAFMLRGEQEGEGDGDGHDGHGMVDVVT